MHSSQTNKFAPKFDRLRSALEQDPNGMALRNDPDALAPEKLIVFEVKDSVQNFFSAIQKVSGLEYIGELEQEADGDTEGFLSYLMIPDATALKQILSLWERYKNEENFDRGFSAWKHVFATLNDVRRWGAKDRLNKYNRELFQSIIESGDSHDNVFCEIELTYRPNDTSAKQDQESLISILTNHSAEIRNFVRIPEIKYHGILAKISISEIQAMLENNPSALTFIDTIFHIRPQSIVSNIETSDSVVDDFNQSSASGESILALLDGVATQSHPWLKDHINVIDMFDLESNTIVEDRKHGTAMASAIIHGDRHNQNNQSLSRKIVLIPVLSVFSQFPKDHLIIDLIYRAVMNIFSNLESGKKIFIINLSIGDSYNIFQGRVSSLARLIDWLAFEHGILFIISAGNHKYDLAINSTIVDESSIIKGLSDNIGLRRLLSPAESVNCLTIGAWNHNDIQKDQWKPNTDTIINPFPNINMSNPSSALGPGFANGVKPEILMPGSREHLTPQTIDSYVFTIAEVNSNSGIKVAATNFDSPHWLDTHTWGTSVAAALASRTAHLIHDALEEAYGDDFLTLEKHEKSVLIKALLVHTAWWPEATAKLITKVLEETHKDKGIKGPNHIEKRDQVRRFLGFGISHPEIAQTCADDRATFWAVGTLEKDQKVRVEMPLPDCLNAIGKFQIHATLAWFTPIRPDRAVYRTIRLRLNDPKNLTETLGLKPSSNQPDQNMIRRGTVSSRFWDAEFITQPISDEFLLQFDVQRELDTGVGIDEPIPFGLAITITAENTIELYNQARLMVDQINARSRIRGGVQV